MTKENPFDLDVGAHVVRFQFAPKNSSYWTRGVLNEAASHALNEKELKVNFGHTIDFQTGVRKYRRGISILVADFDRLPVDEGFDTWSEFLSMLRKFYPTSIVLHSRNGRVKCFFLADFTNVKVTRENRLNALLAILPEFLHPYVDVMGVDESFFSAAMLTEWLHQQESTSIAVFNVSELLLKTDTSGLSTKGKATMAADLTKLSSGVSLKSCIRLASRSDSSFNRVLSNVVATPHVTEEKGAQLPQGAIAASLGISQAAVNRSIRKSVKEGLLVLVNAKYFPGKQSKAYRLVDPTLVEAHKEFMQNISYMPRGEMDCLPALVEGNTYASIPAYVRSAKGSGLSEVECAQWIFTSSQGKMTERECVERVHCLWRERNRSVC